MGRTYRKGYYFYSPQSSTVIKSKMAATTRLPNTNKVSPTQNTPALQATGQQNHSSCLDYVIEFRSAKFGTVHPNFVFKLGDKGCLQIFKAINKLLEIILRSDGHTDVDQRGPAKLTGENILGKQQQKHRVCQTGIYFWFLNTI